VVQQGAVVQFQAGCLVKFATGKAIQARTFCSSNFGSTSFSQVNGGLVVRGTQSARVTFTSLAVSAVCRTTRAHFVAFSRRARPRQEIGASSCSAARACLRCSMHKATSSLAL
jgi:hypothetical protein